MYFYDKNKLRFKRYVNYEDTGMKTGFEAEETNWMREARTRIIRVVHKDEGGTDHGAGRCLVCGFDQFILNAEDECCMQCNAIFEEGDVVRDSMKEKEESFIETLKYYSANNSNDAAKKIAALYTVMGKAGNIRKNSKMWALATSDWDKYVASTGEEKAPSIIIHQGNYGKSIPAPKKLPRKKKA